jgi:DNA-binding NarL/FixJ family response regulator
VTDDKGLVTVLLVDDHAVVREGYRRLLERHGDIVVVGEAENADVALTQVQKLAPQIVVMDISLPGMNGITAMRLMHEFQPRPRVLIFSMHEEIIFVKRALQAGAFGYVTKSTAPNEMVDAVRMLAGGKKYISTAMAQKLALIQGGPDMDSIESLSAREMQVLRLLVQGLSVKDIAEALGMNAKTAANYQSAIRQKLGADTAIQLLRKADQLGLDIPL